jgi:hypothetical protein
MTIRRDTGRALLPALPTFVPGDVRAMSSWAQKVAERLEVREGSRGNPFERAVTLRELESATAGLVQITDAAAADPGSPTTVPLGNGLSASVNIDRFVDLLRETRLYKDLLRRLDDPDRFNAFAIEIRSVLLKSIADEAFARGTDIRRTETLIQDTNRALALAVNEITAALGVNSAGIRELQTTYVNQQSATAAKVTQLEVSLGNYYQDGSPGRVTLEQELVTQASFTEGLRGQYTLKIQAGGALAGFGLAAQEVNGVPSSAFIISADKFAIVSPNYSGGLTNNPNVNSIPFGVDANGIFMNSNVYIRGQMRVDTGGKTLIDGLRGSLTLSASGSAWSDTTARQAIWAGLGKTESAPDSNHLVIGDLVTISSGAFSEARQWNGTQWVTPGAVFTGSMLVDGTVSASKINTQGLSIRNASGNIVFTSGVSNTINAAYISGLGALASRNDVRVGDTVRFADGSVMYTTDFVNRLSKIGTGNIENFMDTAAIGNAYIGTAAVDTLKIAGNAVTVPASSTGQYSAAVTLPFNDLAPGDQIRLLIMGTFVQGSGKNGHIWRLKLGGGALTAEGPIQGTIGTMMSIPTVGPGTYTISIECETTTGDGRCGIFVMGSKR